MFDKAFNKETEAMTIGLLSRPNFVLILINEN